MEIITGTLLLAALVEGTITYLFGEKQEGQPPRQSLKAISLLLGVVAAVAYQADIFTIVGLTPIIPAIGYVATGLVIGRGSNYLNDFVTAIRKQN
jgi:hypothetical protein